MKYIGFLVVVLCMGCPPHKKTASSEVSVSVEENEGVVGDPCIRPTREDNFTWNRENQASCVLERFVVAPITSGGQPYIQVTFKMIGSSFGHACSWKDLNSSREERVFVQQQGESRYSFVLPRSSFPEQFFLRFKYRCHNEWRWNYNPHNEVVGFTLFRRFERSPRYSCKTHRKKTWRTSTLARDHVDLAPWLQVTEWRIAQNRVLN